MKRIAAFTVCLLICAGVALAMGGKPKMPEKQLPEKLYAIFETSQGKIVCLLYPRQAPETVANFVGLAQGSKDWTDPRTGEKGQGPLYNGTIFHRVIPDFMIQGGDPLGLGIGGPGYKFKDEFAPDLGFDRPGRLAMANSGPGTNGSQFFITVAPTVWLNSRHTIFGQVIEGQDIVEAISQVKRDGQDRPLQPIVLKKLTITEQL